MHAMAPDLIQANSRASSTPFPKACGVSGQCPLVASGGYTAQPDTWLRRPELLPSRLAGLVALIWPHTGMMSSVG
jgi:hypothetical protein